MTKTAFSCSPPVHTVDLEGPLRVDFTRSRSRRRMPGFCAQRPSASSSSDVDIRKRLPPLTFVCLGATQKGGNLTVHAASFAAVLAISAPWCRAPSSSSFLT